MKTLDTPRVINPELTFGSLVDWFYDEIVVKQEAPGLLFGLSGTDSLVAFCAAYYALERAGKGHRLMGIHFAPSEDFLYDHPEAEEHTWFRDKVIPWLAKLASKATITVDSSIDWRYDGLRWGSLLDFSVVSNERRRLMRLPEEQYWVVGTRNLKENELLEYSNASTAVSIQPLIHLWKSEILQISEYLQFPAVAITKSCETDCICGRQQLASDHIKEVDWLLMVRRGDLAEKYVQDNIPAKLRLQLTRYIDSQIAKGFFKKNIPYLPEASVVHTVDPLVQAFEDHSLNLKEFNHRKHLYVAWYYLKNMPFGQAVGRYAAHLFELLNAAGYTTKFDLGVTEKYFFQLDAAMQRHPMDNFDELVVHEPELLISKKS